jgi:hypothetical protein
MEKALTDIISITESRRLTSLALPLPGVCHGRIPAVDSVKLFVRTIRKAEPRYLMKVRLSVPDDQRNAVWRLLAEIEDTFKQS